MLNSLQFCVYLTIYSGNKLPPFYIGSSSIKKVKSGYHGSPTSRKYGEIFHKELNNNPNLFKTIILYKFYSRKNATYHERLLQIQFNVVKSDQFINMSLAKYNGCFGMDTSGENNRGFGLKGEKHWNYGKKRTDEWKKNRSKRYKGEGNPRYGLPYHPTEESNKKRSLSAIGGNNSRAKPVIIDGIYYSCKKEAMKILNISIRKLNKILC